MSVGELIIEDSGAKLLLQQGNLVVKNANREIVHNKALHRIDNVLIFGNPSVTTQCLKALAKSQVGVHYFDQNGKYLTSLDSIGQENYEKQVQQFKAFLDENFRLALAKRIIVNKIFLQQKLLEAYDEDHLLNNFDYENFHQRINGVKQAKSIPELIGQEGRAAKSYFHYLGLLIHSDFRFRGRTRHPAKNPANAMLNMGYSLLYANMRGWIKKYGLHLGIACIHKNKGSHATLVSDLMEVWRPIIVDDTVMGLCKHERMSNDHFVVQKDESVIVGKEGRKLLYEEIKYKLTEKHHYLAKQDKLFTATYSIDLQIASLQRAIDKCDAQEYLLLGMDYHEMV